MGLLDEIRDAQHKPSAVCVFGEFILTLSNEDSDGLKEALKDKAIASRAIFVACRNNGFIGGDSVVRRHRRGECICL